MPITPQRAAVRPRVTSPGEPFTAAELLEDHIASWLAKRTTVGLALVASPGAGLSTALQHAAHLFAGEPRLKLHERGVCLLHAAPPEREAEGDEAFAREAAPKWVTLQLAPWSEDECIEYLLHRHPQRCASVMRRLQFAGDLPELKGTAELVSTALDVLAADESVGSAMDALARQVDALLARTESRSELEALCLRSALEPATAETIERLEGAGPRFSGDFKLLRHAQARATLAARELVKALGRAEVPEHTLQFLPIEVERRAAPLLRASPPALRTLLHGIESAKPREAGVMASLLHAADAGSFAGWIKARTGRRERPLRLARARLRRAPWSGLFLSEMVARECDFSEAQLTRVTFFGGELRGSNFARADLSAANLKETVIAEARLVHAKLVEINAYKVNFSQSDLRSADLSNAELDHACFNGARLNFTLFRGAVLTRARLQDAQFEESDFSTANLSGADLRDCDLRTCMLRGAKLESAHLQGAQLTELDLRDVSAAGAVLTGAVLHGANLRGADLSQARLRNARLANLDAEGADFSGADFSGAIFRLGTTRSGLVLNAPPMEGTRTGFYSDEFFDNPHRAPEEVRTANLQRVKLWGAKVEETDFYLVDLRGAIYDEQQAAHFRRCGAILRDRDE